MLAEISLAAYAGLLVERTGAAPPAWVLETARIVPEPCFAVEGPRSRFRAPSDSRPALSDGTFFARAGYEKGIEGVPPSKPAKNRVITDAQIVLSTEIPAAQVPACRCQKRSRVGHPSGTNPERFALRQVFGHPVNPLLDWLIFHSQATLNESVKRPSHDSFPTSKG